MDGMKTNKRSECSRNIKCVKAKLKISIKSSLKPSFPYQPSSQPSIPSMLICQIQNINYEKNTRIQINCLTV